MAEILGVNRMSLREAIQVLSVMRVLSIKPGSGTFISSQDPVNLSNNFKIKPMQDKRLLFEMISAIVILEPQVAKIAAQKRTKVDLEELCGLMYEFKEKVSLISDSGVLKEEILKLENRIHIKIAEATHNSLMYELILLIRDLKDNNQMCVNTKTGFKFRYKDTINFHEEIFSALLNKEEELAYKLMEGYMKR